MNFRIIDYLYLSIFALFFLYFLNLDNTKNKFTVMASSENTVMVNEITGKAWVLEKKHLLEAEAYGLNRSADFVSPQGIYYYWVPTPVLPCYKESLGMGHSPKETNEADDYGLKIWEHEFLNNDKFN